MITLGQLIKRANDWLREKGSGPLNHHEIVRILIKIANVLESKKHNNLEDLEKNLVLCVGINICRLRGYRVPKIVNWRNKELDTVKEDW